MGRVYHEGLSFLSSHLVGILTLLCNITIMPSCSGNWSGEGSGPWVGQWDDSNLQTLNREINGNVLDCLYTVTDIQTQCRGQYGFQGSWDLLHGLSVNWDAWFGVAVSHSYTWQETARQVDGINEIVASNAVDLADCLVKLRAVEAKTEQIYTALGNVANLVNSCLTAISGVRDALAAFRDECFTRLFRVVQSVVAFLEAYLLPLYRICRADGSAAGDIGEVTVTPELQVTNSLTSRASDAVVSSASAAGISVDVHRLSDYGLFYPIVGHTEMFYSDELRQVIARPYRNDGKVYLS